MANNEENLLKSVFTIGWLAKELKKSVNAEAELNAWSAKQIGIGEGFCSLIIDVQLEWIPSTAGLPTRVVLKVPNLSMAKEVMSSEMHGDVDRWLPDGHENECVVYRTFATNTIPTGWPAPRCYLAQSMGGEGLQSGLIVMDSLVGRGRTARVIEGLQLEQVLSVADSVARFQAMAMANESWVDKFVLDKQLFHTVFGMMQEMIESKVLELKPEYAVLYQQTKRYFTSADAFNRTYSSHKDLGMRAVMVHGDMWTSNMLFANNDDGSLGDELLAFVDWQVMHPGNCCADLARVLFACTDGAFRRANTDRVLQHYHARLCHYLGKEKPPPFSIEEVRRAFDTIAPYALMCLAITVPFWLNGEACQEPDRQCKVETVTQRLLHVWQDVAALKL